MKIVAKSEISIGFKKYVKGSVIEVSDRAAEGLISAGCAMSAEVADQESKGGTQAASTALDAAPEDTAVSAPTKGKKPGFFKKK